VSDLAGLLDRIVGDDEWSRRLELDRLRAAGAPAERVRDLLTALDTDDSRRRAGARMALAALADPSSPVASDVIAGLADALRSANPDLRVIAVSALGESRNPDTLSTLVQALDDPAPNVAAAAADALGEIRHLEALEPLAARVRDGSPWVRVAAVVALGRLKDPAVLPALDDAANTPGLDAALVDAVRDIGDPAGLSVLEKLAGPCPSEALEAAGEILSAHPDSVAPAWVVSGARAALGRLRDRLAARDDPGAARLLGVAGNHESVQALLDAILPPSRSEAALAGLLAIPAGVRRKPVLDRLGEAEPEDQVMLLSLLPPLREPGAVAALVPLLHHSSGQVRAAAAEALARSSDPASVHALEEELGRDPVPPEVVRAAGALGMDACLALSHLLGDPEPAVRAAAADALGRCAAPSLAGALVDALGKEADPAARRSMLRSLGRVAGSAAVPVLEHALRDRDPESRVVAIEALGATGSQAAIPHLRRALQGEPPEMLAAIRALGDLGQDEVRELVMPFLRDSVLDTRRAAVTAVAMAGMRLDSTDVEILAADPDAWIRRRAVAMLAGRGAEARAVIERIARQDPEPSVRSEARRVLGQEA
jgi:HEAT repeat protein